MNAEEQQNELTDVVLCYQSMGIPLDASPAVIEQTFRRVTEEYRQALNSPDPKLREEAKVNLELMGEMYEKIRSSITYRAMEKEYQKKLADAAAAGVKAPRPVHQVVAEQRLMINCPRCNGSIKKGTKVCPICKSPVLTPAQRLMKELFTPQKMVIYCIVLLLAALAALFVLRPELLRGAKKEAPSAAEGTGAAADGKGAPK